MTTIPDWLQILITTGAYVLFYHLGEWVEASRHRRQDRRRQDRRTNSPEGQV